MTTISGERSGGAAMSMLDRWGQYMAAQGNSPATIGTRTRTIQALMRHARVTQPTDLTRADCVAFLGRPLAQWTRLSYWKSLQKLSEFLREFDLDPTSDLVRGVRRPGTPAPVAHPLTDETVAQLLATPLSPRASAYVRLAVLQGLRAHEIARLRGEQLDIAAGWMTVRGKGGYEAAVPVHPDIARLAEQMPAAGFWFTSYLDPTRCVSPKAVSLTVKNALLAIGCTARPHQLRDTFGTRVQRRGKDLRVTQQMLRHRSVRSTQKYTGVADDDLQAAILSLDWHHAA